MQKYLPKPLQFLLQTALQILALFSLCAFAYAHTAQNLQALNFTVQGSAINADSVLILANNTVHITSSAVAGKTDTTIIAGQNLIIDAAQNTLQTASSQSDKKSGLFITGGANNTISINNSANVSSTAQGTRTTMVGSSISSSQGSVNLTAQSGTFALIASNAAAAKELNISGAQVIIMGGLNSEESESSSKEKSTNLHFAPVKPSQGMLSRGTSSASDSATTLAATTLTGGSITITATGNPNGNAGGVGNGNASGITLAGVQLVTPGRLTLDAGSGTLALNVIQTSTSTSREASQRDIAYQTMQGAGSTTTDAQYNSLSYGTLTVAAAQTTIQQGVNTGDNKNKAPAPSLQQLSSQPGMAWINDIQAQTAELARTNPAAAARIEQVNLAQSQWDYKKQGLTKEGAAIVTLVVAYFTAGAASGAGTAVASGAGMTAATGATAAGTIVIGGGLTVAGTIVAGAATAAITTLATQVSISLINNQGNLNAVFQEIGSKDSMRSLITAMVTGGALGGLGNAITMDVNGVSTPLNQISISQGASPLQVLGRNLINTTSGAVINTAVNGGNLGDNLTQAISTGFINTGAALSANFIGSNTAPGSFANFAGHAIAGCAAGALRVNNSSGCAPAALGAMLGEATAITLNGNRTVEDILANGPLSGTNELAALVGGIGVAVVGGSSQQINLGANAATNAAENNFVRALELLARAAQQLAQGGMQTVSTAGQAALQRCMASTWCASLPLMAVAMATLAPPVATPRLDGAADIPTGLSGTSTPGTPLPPPAPLTTPVAGNTGPNNTGGTQLDQPQAPATTGGSIIATPAAGSNVTTTPITQPMGNGIVVSQNNNSDAQNAAGAADNTRIVGGVTVSNINGGTSQTGNVNLGLTLDRIADGVRDSHIRDGTQFNNIPKVPTDMTLPPQNPGYYTEHVVRTPGINTVGPQRIVTGQNGEVYYTPDHYHTFIPLNPRTPAPIPPKK